MWACFASFFFALGLDEVCTADAWNLPSEGTGVGISGWSVQPQGLAHWRQFVSISCTRVVAHGQTCVPCTLSAPPHHTSGHEQMERVFWALTQVQGQETFF